MLLQLAFISLLGASSPTPKALPLPNGGPGIGFDDLRFSPQLQRVLAPAGRSGKLDLIEPRTLKVTAVDGFSEQSSANSGHDFGVTSVDEAHGLLYTTDRTKERLDVVDPAKREIIASAALGGGPDYVRVVEPTGEIWVTEPDRDAIEIFSLPSGKGGKPKPVGEIAIKGGPESLVIDAAHGRAYTHLWKGKTLAIDLKSRAIVARWPNGCASSRGIALDAAHGLLFAGCSEGKAVVLDVKTGRQLSSLTVGKGVDIIDFNAKRRHLYLPSSRAGELAVLGVSPSGHLRRLGKVPVPTGAHCVTSDETIDIFVCDPKGGTLQVVTDTWERGDR